VRLTEQQQGELFKKLASPRTELLWKRYAYTHRKEDGSYPQQEEFIKSVIKDAKQGFPENLLIMLRWLKVVKKREDITYTMPIEEAMQLLDWFEKQFGGSEALLDVEKSGENKT
jgi:hypothetical protein